MSNGKKLTVFIKGHSTTIRLLESIHIFRQSVTLKSATVFWDYDNVVSGVNDTINYSDKDLTVPQGYYAFEELAAEMNRVAKAEGIATDIEFRSHGTTGKCDVMPGGGPLKMKKMGELLGFDEGVEISKDEVAPSDKVVNINSDLRYIQIFCDIVDRYKNVDESGRNSRLLATVAIPDERLKGTATTYTELNSRVMLSNGDYREIEFSVRGNNGVDDIGDVLVELYIGPANQ